jgi:hypothetical protein
MVRCCIGGFLSLRCLRFIYQTDCRLVELKPSPIQRTATMSNRCWPDFVIGQFRQTSREFSYTRQVLLLRIQEDENQFPPGQRFASLPAAFPPRPCCPSFMAQGPLGPGPNHPYRRVVRRWNLCPPAHPLEGLIREDRSALSRERHAANSRVSFSWRSSTSSARLPIGANRSTRASRQFDPRFL